jgi:hypothetical protein
LVETPAEVHPLDACDGIHAEDNELCLSCQVKTAMIRICSSQLLNFSSKWQHNLPVTFSIYVEQVPMQRVFNQCPDKYSCHNHQRHFGNCVAHLDRLIQAPANNR